ncbi:hypothetical protein RB601_004802 [Gaeumannomyces tritici]
MASCSGGSPSEIPSEGLTVLRVPDTQPSVDIVFVHGFTGHPYLTWRKCGVQGAQVDAEDGAEPPRKLARFLQRSSARETSSVYWPTDLLPSTIPDARIMTYGYDTHIRHQVFGPRASQNTIYDIAGDFLVALEAERRGATHRPLIFIAHSLGGIVVKEMLRRSQGCHSHDHLRQATSATIGVVFFGTPHSGADPRGLLLHATERLARTLGVTVSQAVVDTLLPSSERLRELRDDFPIIAQRKGWAIHSFQEQHVVRLLGKKVVEDTSSSLHSPIEITQHIANDHMDMCRFSGLLDVEYRKVAAALQRLVQCAGAAERAQCGVLGPALPGTHAQKCKDALESLAFEHMGDRQMGIKRAHRKTCKWFLTVPEYIDWQGEAKMTESNGVLWIKGKAGTGKSTLMKYLLEGAKKGLGGSRVVSFFFHARGDELEKSTVGMYRHLIIQILQEMNENDLAVIWKRFIEDSGLGDPAASPHWTVDLLKDLFRAAVLAPGHRLTCFVDALDECDESEIRDMLGFFAELGELSLSQGAPFRACFSSRHYPHITVDKCLELNLDVQSGHERDIVSYLESDLNIGKNKTAKEVRAEMLKSASGIFMWAVLVTQILNREFDRGNIHALKKKLKEIPKDLHTLFESILTRDEDNKAQLLLCIQWTLYARRPLAPEELYFAIVPYDSEPGEVAIRHQPWDSEEITRDHMQRFIVSSSKGLVEVTSTKKSTVQFIHESIRDYLFKGGLEKVWSDLKGDFGSISHDALKDGCLSYIRQGTFDVVPESSSAVHPDALSTALDTPFDLEALPDAPLDTGPGPGPLAKTENGAEKSKDARARGRRLCRTFPFLQYALQNVIYHSDRAQQGGICQLQFLQDFPKHRWVELDNAIAMYGLRKHTKNVSLIYLLAEQDAASLIKASPDPLPYRHYTRKSIGQERYGAPLVAAIAHGSHEAIGQLLLSDADLSGFVGAGFVDDTSAQATKGRQNLQLKWEREHSMAYYLCVYGYAPFLKHLALAATKTMQQGALSVDVVKSHLLGVDMLRYIGEWYTFDAEKAKPAISSGACQIPWYAQHFRRAIANSFLQGDLSCLKDGLDHGDDPSILADGNIWDWTYISNWEDKLTQNPPGLRQNLRLLAGAGYDVNVLLDELVWRQVDVSIPSFLLERWADLHIWAAAGLGDMDAVIKLLDKGLDVNARDHCGRPALWYAVHNNHEDLLETLLAERGADPNLVDLKGFTLLHHMADFKGQMAIPLAKLIKYGVNVNAKSTNGGTPLHVHGNQEICALLIQHGADVNAKNTNGGTPLHVHENQEICALLIQHGADVNAKNTNGGTPLHVHENQEICALLIQHGADVNAKNTNGGTPLHVHENQEICALLIQHGADVNAKDNEGRTPLHRHDNPEILKLLCKNGADLEARDDEGYTPLLRQLVGWYFKSADALLKQGASKDARSKDGKTAWQLLSGGWSRGRILELLGPEP